MLSWPSRALTYAAHHLRIDTDTNDLFARSLPWRQAQIREDKNFPQFNDLIVAVVRADTPEEAHRDRGGAECGAGRRTKPTFIDSDYPAGSPFYAHEGLLLLPTASLRNC